MHAEANEKNVFDVTVFKKRGYCEGRFPVGLY
jgi:hypothetical protein